MKSPEPPPFDGELTTDSRDSADSLDSRGASIAERAYFLWLERGSPDDSALNNWLDAEREISGNEERSHSPAAGEL